MYVTLASFFFRSSSQSCYVNHIFIRKGKQQLKRKRRDCKKKKEQETNTVTLIM